MNTVLTPREAPERVPWYAVALTKRWLTYLLLTAIFAGTCIALSTWQFNRREEAQREISRVLANYEASPITLNEALPNLDTFDPDDKWIPVTVTGTYLSEEQFIVRSRPREQQAGVEVLTPLLTDQGNVFVINRGWLPVLPDGTETYTLPAPPSGEVTVVARLKAGEPAIPGREAAGNQLATIELPLIADIIGYPTYTGAYGVLDSETPPPSENPPLAAKKPSLDEGAHLSYAYQWIMFGVLAFIALVWAIRNELRLRNAETDEGKARELKRQQKRASQPTEEDIEDALLDQASR
ncbi:SURF1 family protein [Aurantimicrobium sp. MWH-Uga1]|uniref:SURF1 family cytochrome oxidase biogenesis protein n=1 Tax=Aurantimicrobium sp. MWH-Uga1 TaxID=2079575 RepID=UPI000DED65F2|nr:SURF1 family protein [Aurantimicrobium sp. MWH-Uga1]AXE54466.1 SURF1 family protein [Aurantimicrobium sp. MWH-Uga1]